MPDKHPLDESINALRALAQRLDCDANGEGIAPDTRGKLRYTANRLFEEIGGLKALRKTLTSTGSITAAAFEAAMADAFDLSADRIPAVERSTKCPHCGAVGCSCGCNDCVDSKEFSIRGQVVS